MKQLLITVLIIIIILLLIFGIWSYQKSRANIAPPYICDNLSLTSAKQSPDDNQRYYNFEGTCQVKVPQGSSWVYQTLCVKIAAAWDRSRNTAVEVTELITGGSGTVKLQLQCADDPWVSDARCAIVNVINSTAFPSFNNSFIFYNRQYPPLARNAAVDHGQQSKPKPAECVPSPAGTPTKPITSPKGVYPIPQHYARTANVTYVTVYVEQDSWWHPCPYWNPWCNNGCPYWKPWCNPWYPPAPCPWWNPSCNPWYPPMQCPWWNRWCNPWEPVCPWWKPWCTHVRPCPPWNPNCSGPLPPVHCPWWNPRCLMHPQPPLQKGPFIKPISPEKVPVHPVPIINPLHPVGPLKPITPLIHPIVKPIPPPIKPITPVHPVPIKPMPPIKPVPPIQPIEPIKPHPIQPIEPIQPTPPIRPIEPISPQPPIRPIKPVEPINPPPIHPIEPIAPMRPPNLPSTEPTRPKTTPFSSVTPLQN